jgi:hypothetical protein
MVGARIFGVLHGAIAGKFVGHDDIAWDVRII